MGRRRYIPIANGHYTGDLSAERQEQILATQNETSIEKLKHMIFNFPDWLIEEADKADQSILTYCRENNIKATDYRGKMRDYQTVGTGFLYLSPFSMLGDGVGVGKTVEVAALINMLRMMKEMNRVLIAVENGAVGQMVREMKKFTGMRVVELPSLANKMEKVIERTDWSKVEIIVTKHTALKSNKFFEWLGANTYLDERGKTRNNIYDVFILDESSIIKSPDTLQYTYTKSIAEMARRAHLMNATAFETHILDIYYQMSIIIPDALPSKSAITSEYCTYRRDQYWKTVNGKAQPFPKFELAGYKNEEDFKQKLKLFYFARSLKDVGLQGNNIYLVSEVTPTNDQLRAINKGYRANEVLNDPTLITDIKIETRIEDVPKIYRLVTMCTEDFKDSNILIYCFHRNAQYVIKDLLEKAGRKVGIINSSVKDKDRQETMDKFNSGEIDVLITNVKRSLNLYNGDVCIMYSMEANPAKMEQIRGRIDRHVDDRQKVFVLMYYLMTFEFDLFFGKAKSRNKAAKDLTIEFESAVDYFLQAVEEDKRI